MENVSYSVDQRLDKLEESVERLKNTVYYGPDGESGLLHRFKTIELQLTNLILILKWGVGILSAVLVSMILNLIK